MPPTAREKCQSGSAKRRPSSRATGKCAHRDDVAEDPTDPGGSALERLDRGGMVVALDLERDGSTVPEVQHARVLAWSLEDSSPVDGSRFRRSAGVLVAAVPDQRSENTASSKSFGSRDSSARIRSNSPSVRPSARWRAGSAAVLRRSAYRPCQTSNGEVASPSVASTRARVLAADPPARGHVGRLVPLHQGCGRGHPAGCDDRVPRSHRRPLLLGYLVGASKERDRGAPPPGAVPCSA